MKRRASEYEARLTVQGSEPTFDDDGVDLTQIRRALALTPLERLVLAERTAIEIQAEEFTGRPKDLAIFPALRAALSLITTR